MTSEELVKQAIMAAERGDKAEFSRLWLQATEDERWEMRAAARVKSITRNRVCG